jgi:hypothetical protein
MLFLFSFRRVYKDNILTLRIFDLRDVFQEEKCRVNRGMLQTDCDHLLQLNFWQY